MADRSVSVPDGWEQTGDASYRYPTRNGMVLVEVVDRSGEYQVRASALDDDALVSRNDFLVATYDDPVDASDAAASFVSDLHDELDARDERSLSRVVDETADGFDTGGFWIFG